MNCDRIVELEAQLGLRSLASRPNALLHGLNMPTSHCVAVSSSLMEKIHV